MKIDNIALIFACIAGGIWAIVFISGVLASGLFGLVLLIPILVVGYLFGVVVSQRLNNRDDDHYDNIER